MVKNYSMDVSFVVYEECEEWCWTWEYFAYNIEKRYVYIDI